MGAALQLPTYQKVRILNVKSKKTGYQWLQNYSNFKNQNFDANIEMILAEKKKFFSRKQLCILAVLRQYAVKYGVVNASRNTIIDALEKQFGFRACTKTVTNLFNKIEKMGIAVIHPGEEYDGSYTSNVVVFNTYEDMKAYEIAQIEAEEAEIEKRMMQDLVKTDNARNYAEKARQWAAEKAKKDAAIEAAKKIAEGQQKRETIYKKLMAFVAAKKINKSQAGQLAAILYKRINEAMAADSRLTQEQAELLAWDAFTVSIASKYKNLLALVSYKAKEMFDKFANGYKPAEFAAKRSNTSTGRTEQVPEWFNDRNVNTSPTTPDNTIDFEAERAKVLEKLGQTVN